MCIYILRERGREGGRRKQGEGGDFSNNGQKKKRFLIQEISYKRIRTTIDFLALDFSKQMHKDSGIRSSKQ